MSTNESAIVSSMPLGDIARHDRIDELQATMDHIADTVPGAALDCPLTHQFVPGMYIRTIFMPKGAIIVSKIHKTQHPYVITKGRCSVQTDEGWVDLEAGHQGITQPGTRRVLVIHEDTVWTTYHPTKETDIDVIESQIIEPLPSHQLNRGSNTQGILS